MLVEVARQDDICVLRLKGRFVAGEDLEELLAKADEIKRLTCGKVLVDLREVPAMGSTGIGFLVGIYTSVTKNADGRFVLVGANPRVREVLEITHLSTVIPMAPDLASGEATLSGAGGLAAG
jgi:anti-anti-sigma factor